MCESCNVVIKLTFSLENPDEFHTREIKPLLSGKETKNNSRTECQQASNMTESSLRLLHGTSANIDVCGATVSVANISNGEMSDYFHFCHAYVARNISADRSFAHLENIDKIWPLSEVSRRHKSLEGLWIISLCCTASSKLFITVILLGLRLVCQMLRNIFFCAINNVTDAMTFHVVSCDRQLFMLNTGPMCSFLIHDLLFLPISESLE